jgi:hypothetical protein
MTTEEWIKKEWDSMLKEDYEFTLSENEKKFRHKISQWIDHLESSIKKKDFKIYFDFDIEKTESLESMENICYFIYLNINLTYKRYDYEEDEEDDGYLWFYLDLTINPDEMDILIHQYNWFDTDDSSDIFMLMSNQTISLDDLAKLIIKNMDFNDEKELLKYINTIIRET